MCNCNKKRERWEVTLPKKDGTPGIKVTKSSEKAAKAYAAAHPGATYKKVG